MKGFILAAGLGTRLKPWTDTHPKAMVPVAGVPMLQRVVEKMHEAGIRDIAVNAYHHADQIVEFLKERYPEIKVSDERPELLETGGALLGARDFIAGEEPVLVHNADILSNADFRTLEDAHKRRGATATLLVNDRDSSRKLVFSPDMRLRGWHSLKDTRYRPDDFCPVSEDRELAFSGIYIVSPSVIGEMERRGMKGKFSIMDFFLGSLETVCYHGFVQSGLRLLDIGKPDSLSRADAFLSQIGQ